MAKQALEYERLTDQSSRNTLISIQNFYERTMGESLDTHNRSKLKINVKQIFDMFWKEYMNLSTKATSFNEFKTIVKCENYLKIKNRKHRVVLTKLRLSDHILMIEKGRHSRPRMERENRLCPLCEDRQVETEAHFVAECTKFCDERTLFFNKVQTLVPNFRHLNAQERFCFLFSQEDLTLLELTAKILYNWYETRTLIK